MLSTTWPGKEDSAEPPLACFLAVSLFVSLNLAMNQSSLGREVEEQGVLTQVLTCLGRFLRP